MLKANPALHPFQFGEEALAELRVGDRGSSGLLGLADRLGVLDGSLRVDSPSDGGTLIAAGEIRLNDAVVARPAQPVRVGDRIDLPIPSGRYRRRVTVLALAEQVGLSPTPCRCPMPTWPSRRCGSTAATGRCRS